MVVRKMIEFVVELIKEIDIVRDWLGDLGVNW